MQPPDCVICRRPMEEGFLLGVDTHRNFKPLEWVNGEPVNRWYGLQLRGRKRLPLQAFRCPLCGWLRIQAMETK